MRDLALHTRRALHEHPDAALCVAFSGGGDSSVLLDVLAGLPEARERGLRAIHVDHGLHPDSARWAEHCRAFCSEREVALECVKVRVSDASGRGPEAAAREARMQAFIGHLRAGEALLLAHHRDDQAETILLKLLRGAGPHGLGGMRPWRHFGEGWLWRPWLDVPRASLREWLGSHALDCIEDPANDDAGMTRSWLRQAIMPRLRAQLPQATASIVNAGRLCAEAGDYLETRLDELEGLVAADGSLAADAWLALPAALRGLLLERWLHRQNLSAPSIKQRLELERQCATAAPDRVPQVHWPDTDVRLWRGRLYASAPLREPAPGWQQTWDGSRMPLPLGTLALSSPGATLTSGLTVRFRRGGEYLHPANDACGRELRYVFQQSGLPPWLRPFCPLVYMGDDLLAVAGLCLTRDGAEYFAPLGVEPEWRYHGTHSP